MLAGAGQQAGPRGRGDTGLLRAGRGAAGPGPCGRGRAGGGIQVPGGGGLRGGVSGCPASASRVRHPSRSLTARLSLSRVCLRRCLSRRRRRGCPAGSGPPGRTCRPAQCGWHRRSRCWACSPPLRRPPVTARLALPCPAASASSPHPGRRVPSLPGSRLPARLPPRRASPGQRRPPRLPRGLVITAKAALPLTRAAGMQFTATPRPCPFAGAVTRPGATRDPCRNRVNLNTLGWVFVVVEHSSRAGRLGK